MPEPRKPMVIDLVEPDAPAPVGDRVPCHLFMPEVAWPAVLPPVLRAPLRELHLVDFEPWRPILDDDGELTDEVWYRVLSVFATGFTLLILFALGLGGAH